VRRFYADYTHARDPARQVAWMGRWDQDIRLFGLMAALPDDAEGTLLDVGCGLGALADHLPPGVHYTGIDLLPDRIAQAKAMRPDLRFEVADVLHWRHGPYDWVVCSGALNVAVAGGRQAEADWFQECVEAMWALTDRAMLFNCLTVEGAGIDPEEDPALSRLPREFVLGLVRDLTPRIVSREDLLPGELTLWCHRDASALVSDWMGHAQPADAARLALHHWLPGPALRALEALGTGPDAENLRAVAELQRGRPGAARNRLETLLAAHPHHEEAEANLETAKKMLGL
jgi:SAM-dependent methyltransferase